HEARLVSTSSRLTREMLASTQASVTAGAVAQIAATRPGRSRFRRPPLTVTTVPTSAGHSRSAITGPTPRGAHRCPGRGRRWDVVARSWNGIPRGSLHPTCRPTTLVRMPLTDRDKAILDFERLWWADPDAKSTAIREHFEVSPARYHQLLGEILS